jgi:two-component system, NtrC family, sensor kinase
MKTLHFTHSAHFGHRRQSGDPQRLSQDPLPGGGRPVGGFGIGTLWSAGTGVKPPVFEMDSAYQGQEGLAMLEQAQKEGRPYWMAFVDVRMPPGWDGVETISRLWEVAPDLQVVICTAYSDYSWSSMTSRLKHRDRLVILKKPFDAVEVLQLAAALTEKWRLLQQSKLKLEQLESLVADRTKVLCQDQ